jgi:signal transduction histidine kinase
LSKASLNNKQNFISKYRSWESVLNDDSRGVAIISVPNYIVLSANKYFHEYFNKENIIGDKLSDIMNNWKSDNLETLWSSFLKEKKPIHFKLYKNSASNPQNKIWNNTIIPIWENDKVEYLISIIYNISDQLATNRLEEHNSILLELERNEKTQLQAAIEMKDEFLSIISHEFKTPLTVINSALQMMDFYINKGEYEKSFKFIDNIKRNVFRQLRLINNLLDISKANAKFLKVNKCNYDIIFLTKSMIQFVSEYAQQKEITLNFYSELESCFLGVDEEKYERIMLNLLSNAIKFTPSGKKVFVNIFKNNERVFIEIKDEGIGIPKEKQPLIFQRFGQVDSSLSRTSEGTGIGLNLVKLLLKQLGGNITFESEEGIGSTFKISLPLIKAEDLNTIESKPNFCNDFVQTLKIEFSDIYLP